MAATSGRLITAIFAVLLVAAACSSSDVDIDAELDASVETSTTSTTNTTTTTTTEATTTTLSELELAEAEIRDVVTAWYEFPFDYSLGEEGVGLDQTTGLLRQRLLEFVDQLESDGLILRSPGAAPIDITSVSVNLEEGIAEVDACTGSADEFIDAETLEVISADDPNETFTSLFQLQLAEGQWKISEWLPSGINGPSVDCEIAA